MCESEDAPEDDGEHDDGDSSHIPSWLKQIKTVLEIVWIMARLLGM
jgi:hypothetical protein